MLARSTARSIEGCLDILRDEQVIMGITVQHMVLRAATGDMHVALPAR
jgi:hypothetical protein